MSGPWHLPGYSGRPESWHEGTRPGGAPFRTPALTRADAAQVADTLRESVLRARAIRSVDQVIGAIDRVTTRLGDADRGRREALACLREGLGWEPPLAEETLDHMRRMWTREALDRLLRSELGNPRVLDAFVPDGDGRCRRASGLPLVLHILSGNVPGVAVTAIVRGLLVRSAVACKAAEDEPFLPALFARLLAEEDPELGSTVAVSWWPSVTEAPEWRAWSAAAEMAVVYGGAEAVRGVRDALPASTELLAYGPRIGVGVVLADAVESADAARDLARDVCAYEQRGCVSPRLVFVVSEVADAGGRFASLLAAALEEETSRIPAPALAPEEAVAVRRLRAEHEFGAYGGEAHTTLLASEPDLRWTVVARRAGVVARKAGGGESMQHLQVLPRVVFVQSIPGVAQLEGALDALQGTVQAIGYAGGPDAGAVAALGARAGACRVAPFGTIAWPPPDWRHDGRFQLLPLLRWTDWEDAVAGGGVAGAE